MSIPARSRFQCKRSFGTDRFCGNKKKKFANLCLALKAGHKREECFRSPPDESICLSTKQTPECCAGKYSYPDGQGGCDGFENCKPGLCGKKIVEHKQLLSLDRRANAVIPFAPDDLAFPSRETAINNCIGYSCRTSIQKDANIERTVKVWTQRTEPYDIM